MSLDLKDFRGKITAETDCVIEAIARSTGEDRAQIVRDALHDWALQKLRMHRILTGLLRAEGLVGASEGAPAASQGLPGASQGMRGSAGE